MTVPTIPSFSRVEIKVRGKDDLTMAAHELRQLASELEFIAGRWRDDEAALILAHHKIKATSQKLRGL